MTSAKLFLCDACLIILVGLTFTFAEDKAVSSTAKGPETVKGNCSCGGFDSRGGAEPILSHSPGLAVECNSAGNDTCSNLCRALATATRAKGPEILCTRIKDCNELKLSVFSKICDSPWVSANMTAEEPLCCENSKSKVCASVQQNTSAAPAVSAASTTPVLLSTPAAAY